MWSRSVQQAGSRSSGKPGSQERRLSISKQLPFRGDVDAAEGVTRRGYVVSGVVIVALLLTGVLTLLSPPLNHFQQHLTQFAAEDSPFDNATWNQSGTSSADGCNINTAKLKVFMYDLPPEFHYGMITEFAPQGNQIWPKNVTDVPKYPGGMYQQHSPEYWLITDLLTSDMADRTSPCTAFRVRRWQDADVVLVPYFASLSYNRYSRPAVSGRPKEWDKNQLLQEKLLEFLTAQPAWLAANGADHVIVIHHPNSMAHSRDRFRNVTFVVADFGRYGNDTANLLKDIVAPYKHVIPSFDDDDDVSGAASFKLRPTLLFFRGAIVRKEGGVIRRELWEILRDEVDVVFSTGETTSAGIRSGAAGMQASKFCLHVAGDTPSSNRLFDAVASHCVPLVISDALELPYEDVLDYTEFCVFVNSTLALQKGFVIDLLRNFSPAKWAEMHARMIQVQRHFQYQHPSVAGDAVHMIWDAIARKVPAFTLARNKLRRYARSRIG